MGCNCGKKAGTVRRTTTGAAGDSVVSASSPRFRSRVRFFVVPPPEESDGVDELVFDTLYEARAALGAREGWRLETRRVERAG